MKLLFQIARLLVAAILLQTLYFKFTGAEESKYIFTQVGAEPFGRYASGVVELIASILLFVPRFVWLGAALAIGVMSGAIFTHLTILGIEVQGDRGLLFGMACVVFLCSAVVLWHKRSDLPLVGWLFKKDK